MSEHETPARGGRRPTTLRARYTQQATGLVTSETKEAVRTLADEFGVSQSIVVRMAIEGGLAGVRRRLSRMSFDERAAEAAPAA